MLLQSIHSASIIKFYLYFRRDGTRIALVTFGTEAVLEFNLGDAKVATLERAIEEIGKVKYAGGATASAKALKLVRTVVAPNARKGSKRAMIFITDGKSNIGGPPEREAKILKENKQFDFEIYAVGKLSGPFYHRYCVCHQRYFLILPG